MKRLLLVFIVCPFLLVGQTMQVVPVEIPSETQPTIQFLSRDQGGFIWFGTKSHLYRYQGTGFKSFYLPEGEQASAYFQTRTGDQYVGFKSGKIGTLTGDSITLLAPPEGTPNQPITGFAEDNQDQLWVATYGEGLYVIATNGRWYNFNVDDHLPSNDVYQLAKGPSGVLAATDQGIAEVHFSSKKTVRTYSKSAGLADNICLDLAPYSSGWLVGHYNQKLTRLSTNLRAVSLVDAPAEALQIEAMGNLTWLASPLGELYYSDQFASWHQLHLEGNAKVKHLLSDTEGHLWLGTNKGLYRVDPWLESLGTKSPTNAVAAAADGCIWMAQGNALFCLMPGETVPRAMGTFGQAIVSLQTDAQNRVWIGTFGSGLCLFNPALGTQQWITEKQGLVNNNVLSLSLDDQGILWLGTLGGAAYINIQLPTKSTTLVGEGLPAGLYIYRALPVSNALYLATDGKGVLQWKSGAAKPLPGQRKGTSVTSLAHGENEVIWLTSSGLMGLWEEGTPCTYVELPAGIQPSALEVEDNGNKIWIFHENGIAIYSKKEKTWRQLDRAFQLNNLRPELNAIAQDSTGDWWIGTASGLKHLHRDVLPKVLHPATELLGTELYFKPTTQTHFFSDQNHLTFKYLGRWYAEPYRVRYKIMLDGYDRNWGITQDEEITYPRLAPGTYTFKVIAGVDGVFPAAEMKQFTFVIAPPFYLRWWFLALSFLLTGFLVYALVRWQVNAAKKRQERERERILAQYQALRSQVNPHFLFNSFNTLMSLIESDTDKAQTYLAQLSDFFRSILQYRHTELIRLEEELTIVKSYLALQAGRYGTNLRVEMDINPVLLDSYIPPLTLQLLVENAIKHNVISRTKPLQIKLYSLAGALVVWNNLQPKAQPEPSTGYGLNSIRQRYQFHSSEPVRVVEDEDGFSISLPILTSPAP